LDDTVVTVDGSGGTMVVVFVGEREEGDGVTLMCE